MTMVTDNHPAGQPRILAGHTAVVTGAGSGVGFACAQLLADAGMALLLHMLESNARRRLGRREKAWSSQRRRRESVCSE